MIISVGVDITDVERVRQLLERRGQAFRARCFTDSEQAYAAARGDPTSSLAARFASKEAVMKALGTGWSQGIRWTDIEVVRQGGPPRVILRGRAKEIADRLGIRKVHLSISHDGGRAVAFVVAEG